MANPFDPFTLTKMLITPTGATANSITTPATQGLGALVSPTADAPISNQPTVVTPATQNAPQTANTQITQNISPQTQKTPQAQINAVQTQPIGQPTVQTQQQQSNPYIMAKVMSDLQAKVTSNNSLMEQRNLLLKSLYDQPLTPEERAKLDPAILKAVDSGDRNLIDTNLRLISDSIQGRTSTLDQSIQYLTGAYKDTITSAETAKQNAIDNVLKFAGTYGSNAKQALTSLYGQDYVDQLKSQGIDLEQFEALPTLAETKTETSLSGPSSYQEWVLAGGQAGTGKTYAQFIESGKPATAAQQTIAGYAVRLEQSIPILEKLEDKITKMNYASFAIQGGLPAAFQSSNYQQYDQAARNFINSVLRRESGAVISPDEFDNARKQYLPMPGDKTDVLEQKKINRNLVYQNLVQSAGTAYSSVSDLLGKQSGAGTTSGVTSSGLKYTIEQ